VTSARCLSTQCLVIYLNHLWGCVYVGLGLVDTKPLHRVGCNARAMSLSRREW